MAIDFRRAEPGSPERTLIRLLGRLEDRVPALRRYDDYYNGLQPLAFASEKFREAFGGRFKEFSSNFMALVVDGTRERLEVTGFRFKDPQGDKDLWAIWQDNDLDAWSQLAHTEALVKGIAYALVEPDGDNTPRITVEDPLDCIVEHDPKDRRKRTSALKRWTDDDGHMVVYVYLPDAIYKYRSEQPWTADATVAVLAGMVPSMTWGAALSAVKFARFTPAGEDWPLANPLGVVPVIPLPNRPRLKLDGQSEIALVLSNQDAINKYRADALIAAEYAAFRQRWAIGIDSPINPNTGLPDEPFEASVSRLWTVPPDDANNPSPTKVEFGEFEATDLAPYKLMIELEVDHISHVTRMPLHQLLGQTQSIPASGEAVKSSETGLISKIGAAQIFLGDGWEETMRVALRAKRDERADIRNAETLWRNPETRNEAVITDAVVKLWTARGGPDNTPILDDRDEALVLIGFSSEAIARLREAREKRPAAADMLTELAATLSPEAFQIVADALRTPAAPGPVVPAPAGPRMGVGVAGGERNG